MTELILNTPEHVIFTAFDDETGLLVDVNTKRYYQLNETGAFIWNLMVTGASKSVIVESLTESFEVETEQAIASVERFISNLKSQKLIDFKAE